jgi:hypothetical protein
LLRLDPCDGRIAARYEKIAVDNNWREGVFFNPACRAPVKSEPSRLTQKSIIFFACRETNFYSKFFTGKLD